MEAIVERLKKLLEFNCRQVIDDDHPLQVDAVGDQAHLVLEVYGRPEDMALSLGAPCSQGTNPHGTMHVAVSGLEKPLAAAVTGECSTPTRRPRPGRERRMPNRVLETALTLLGAGLSLIPIGAQKRPALESWKCYQTRLPTPGEWTAWCAHRPCGLAIVLGGVSGNAEVIDIDDRLVLRPWHDLVEAAAPGLVSRLVIVETPSHCRHLYYRCPVIAGNQKLALNAQRQTMMETRGEGSCALIPPSPA